MYERFTDRARKVMQLANQEAQRLNHEYIGTEHILLGLMKEGSGVAAHVLQNLDIDRSKIDVEIKKFVQSGLEGVLMDRLPQTPRAKQVIEYSIEEARNLNHNYVGTEHLLLGLLREQEGVGAQVLVSLGLKLEDVREEIINLLGMNNCPNRLELATRRIGLEIRKHQIACIFGGGLLTTLAGAIAGVHFLGLGDANSGALVAGGAYVMAIAIACLASRARNGCCRKLS